MYSVLVSDHGLKNELYLCVTHCFGSWTKEQRIFTCSALVSVHGLKNDFDFCVARFFRFID